MQALFFPLLLLCLFAGKPQNKGSKEGIFNAVVLETDTFAGWCLSTNYYTLQNNIETPASSVFIAQNPSLNQIEAALVKLPAHYFLLLKGSQTVAMIVLSEEPKRHYAVVNLATGEPSSFPCNLAGDIAEERAAELTDLGWDPAAKRSAEGFLFNGKTFSILLLRTLKADVLRLIETQRLFSAQPLLPGR